MVSRATHYTNQKRHSQRGFGEVKPRLLPKDVGTTWIPPFVATLSAETPEFNVDSVVALPLGDTSEARSLRLRELSKLGILRMRAHRENGVFIEYRWNVEKEKVAQK